MNRIAVISSDLKSVGYEPSSQTLAIEFRNGALYEYHPVPDGLYAALLSAASHGKFFNQQIRNAGFICTKIG